jgi:hypothetical protein
MSRKRVAAETAKRMDRVACGPKPWVASVRLQTIVIP